MKSLKQQQGVVLVVGLLMLLVITIVGVTAMSDTTMNERMTSNHQFQTLSFQAAESAIHDNFNIPSVSPAVVSFPAAVTSTNNYDVDVSGSTNINVQAMASVQYCGELSPPETELSAELNPSTPMDRLYDVTGSGAVSTLGTQESHMRRGANLMSFNLNMSFDPTLCQVIQ